MPVVEIEEDRKIFELEASVLRIRDVYPGSEFFPSRIRIFSIPDPNFFHTRSWIRINEFKYLNPKK
jgi:hypothetical protein